MPVCLHAMQICDDTNQAQGFAVVGTCGGVARLLVSQSSCMLLAHLCSYCIYGYRGLWLGGSWHNRLASTRYSRWIFSASFLTVCHALLVGVFQP
jgi:hypothetical protein